MLIARRLHPQLVIASNLLLVLTHFLTMGSCLHLLPLCLVCLEQLVQLCFVVSEGLMRVAALLLRQSILLGQEVLETLGLLQVGIEQVVELLHVVMATGVVGGGHRKLF